MRFLSMVKLTEGKSSPPSKAMIDAVNQLVQEVAKEGCVMVQSNGLYPTSAGARVRLAGGKITVIDGPFTEAQGVVVSYAIFDVPCKAHMIRVTERFMALHKTHMPGWEGECELRQLAAPGEPEPCGQPREAEAAV